MADMRRMQVPFFFSIKEDLYEGESPWSHLGGAFRWNPDENQPEWDDSDRPNMDLWLKYGIIY
jgi:hypothetical protein